MGFVVLLIVAIYGLHWVFEELTPAASPKPPAGKDHTKTSREPPSPAGKANPSLRHRRLRRVPDHCEAADTDGDDEIDELEYMRHFFR